MKIEVWKKLCSEPDCYNKVDEDDIERGVDGTIYERSKKCWDCRTDADKKAIKRFRSKTKKQYLENPHTKPPICFTCKNPMEPMKEKDGTKSKHSFHCLKCYPNLIVSIG